MPSRTACRGDSECVLRYGAATDRRKELTTASKRLGRSYGSAWPTSCICWTGRRGFKILQFSCRFKGNNTFVPLTPSLLLATNFRADYLTRYDQLHAPV